MSDRRAGQAAADRQGRAGGIGDRARLHVAVRHLRAGGGRGRDRADPSRARSRGRSFRQFRHVWLGPERGTARPRLPGQAARQFRDRDQVRPDAEPRRRQRRQRPPRICQAGLRREPEAARPRNDRPLLPAPRRSRRAGRGHGRRDEPARRARQGALYRAVRGAPGAAAQGASRCGRSRRCRANSRCSIARRRWRRARRSRISASRLSPTRRSAARLLAGVVPDVANLAEGDTRARHPRFEGDNLQKNRALVERVEAIAADRQCTVAQLSLAWLLAQGPDVLPIPGTKRIERLEENLAALDVQLTQEEIDSIAEAVPAGAAAGTRYPAGRHEGGVSLTRRTTGSWRCDGAAISHGIAARLWPRLLLALPGVAARRTRRSLCVAAAQPTTRRGRYRTRWCRLRCGCSASKRCRRNRSGARRCIAAPRGGCWSAISAPTCPAARRIREATCRKRMHGAPRTRGRISFRCTSPGTTRSTAGAATGRRRPISGEPLQVDRRGFIARLWKPVDEAAEPRR